MIYDWIHLLNNLPCSCFLSHHTMLVRDECDEIKMAEWETTYGPVKDILEIIRDEQVISLIMKLTFKKRRLPIFSSVSPP